MLEVCAVIWLHSLEVLSPTHTVKILKKKKKEAALIHFNVKEIEFQ